MIEETLCPLCGGPMVSRANRATGQRFWGCRKYPDCKGTRNTDGEASRPRSEDAESEDMGLPSDRQRGHDRGRWRYQ